MWKSNTTLILKIQYAYKLAYESLFTKYFRIHMYTSREIEKATLC